ncbi:glycerophosphodiester phosphodiesterase [Legionella geestiana]|nr:glycerophosphodiester phosphodiesterase [Legionella geestiana]
MPLMELSGNDGVCGVKIIAHRGDKAHAPENTLAAFRKAKENGATCVEFDVMLTRDRVAIIMHDETLNRTTNGEGRVGECDADYIAGLDAGSWFGEAFTGEHVPTLKDAILLLNELELDANIEIKPCGDDEALARDTTRVIIDEVRTLWKGKNPPLLSSFVYSCLLEAQEAASDLPRALLMDAWSENAIALARDNQCVSINLNADVLNAERVKLIKNANFAVYAYTVRNREVAQALEEMGVDAIFCDDPTLLALEHQSLEHQSSSSYCAVM